MKRSNENEYTEYDASGEQTESRGGLQIFARIVCLLLAFVIWLYVVDNDSEDYEKTFTLIPIDIEGAEVLAELSGMSVINLEESAVSVTVRGKRSELNALTSEDFHAYVNVSTLTTADRHLLSVMVDMPNGVERRNTEPSAVNVYTDELAERDIPIEVVPKYRMAATYTIDSIQKSIETVRVHGPRELINRIAAARADVELGEVVSSVEATGVLIPVDKDGVEVDGKYLRLDSRDITVRVSVHTEKSVPLTVKVSPDVPVEGYRGYTLSVPKITLRGDPAVLAAIEELAVLNVTTDQIKEYTVPFSSVKLPEGVAAIAPPDSIKVSLIFEVVKPPETTPPETEIPSPETTAVPNPAASPDETTKPIGTR